MALATDYAAAQLMYFGLATNLTVDEPSISTHDLIHKLGGAYPSQADLLWLIYFAHWKLIDFKVKLLGLSTSQTEAIIRVQIQWLKILDHHGDLTRVSGYLSLTDLF
jgi:hypothetical protein